MKGVFGPDSQLCHPRTFFKQDKSLESSFRMLELVKQSTNINSGVDKVDWLVDVNYLSSFTSKIDLSFPPNLRNIIFIGKAFLFKQNCFKRKNSKVQLKWWVQNLRYNGWALVQPPAEVLRQTDA